MNEPPADQGTTAAPAAGRTAGQPAIVFVLALLLVSLSFGSAILLITRSAVDTDSSAESAAATPAATSAPRIATAAPAPIRVLSTSGTAEPLAGGTYRVTFVWVLEGAREGDTALLRFSMGSRVLSEQRGALDDTVFASSTGRLTLSTMQPCSTDGWAAELVTLRGQPLAGDATARVAGVRCPS